MSKRTWVVGGLVVALALAGVVVAGMAASSHSMAAKSGALTAAKADSDSAVEKAGIANEGPEATAAAEDYASRAYPATEIPFAATLNAEKAWAKAMDKPKKSKAGNWTLVGPSSAQFPSVLTFSGADYTTSGRVTALALDPKCSEHKCEAWMGAAGGGVWKTKNAMAKNVKWDVRLGQLRDERDRNAQVRRREQDALRGNRRAERLR